MEPDNNTEVVETPIFTLWLDKTGVLCLNSKEHPPQTLEESRNLFSVIRKVAGKKRCMLMDLTHFQMPTREARDYGAVELPNMVSAIAFLSGSSVGAWVANMFFAIKKQPYPTKMFSDEQSARDWLKQYL